MIPITTFASQRVAIFGLGSSGLVAARALAAGGAEVVAWDDDKNKIVESQAAGVKTQDLNGLDWSKVSALVLAPGIPLTHPKPHWTVDLARRSGVPVIGDIELFCRERAKSGPACPLVAITGTNGKSTTTALTAHLLKSAGRDAKMGGNIGVPALALAPFGPGLAYVLEISSYQIDLAPSLNPTVGILLNVSEDHLDRHGTMENYAALKERLVANVEQGGTAVIDIDDEYTRAAADRVDRAGKHVVRVSVISSVRDGYYADGSSHSSGYERQGASRCRSFRHWLIARRAQRAERRLLDSHLCCAWHRLGCDPKGPQKFSWLGSPHATDRTEGQCAVCERLRRQPMPIRPPKHWQAFMRFSGSRGESRRLAEFPASTASFRAYAKHT